MNRTKKLLALLLSLVMAVAIFPLGTISASALTGMGPPTDMNHYTLGIDISYWQAGDSTGKNVDFNKLKASGCEFVILRLGYGQSVDRAFVSFYNKARAAGMDLGVYLYGLKTTKAGAISDAQWAISVFEQYDMYFEYPIFYDIEESDQIALSSANATALCEGWCDTLKASNYYPGIYSGTQFYNKLYSSFKSSNDLWIAHVLSGAGSEWSSQFTYTSKAYNTLGYTMWQYSWSNIYNGSYIYNGVYKSGTTKVDALDLDVCYKDYPTIMKTYGYNNCASDSKPALLQSINKAKELRYSSYSEASLATLRTAYDNAVAVYNSASSTDTDYKNAKTALDNAMTPAGSSVLSSGCSYTANVTPNTNYPDGSSKLTNGKKSTSGVNCPGGEYVAYYHSGDVEITVDLGSSKSSNIYTAYVASDFWGIPVPNSLKVAYSDSASGPFTEINGNLAIQKLGNGDLVDGESLSVLSSMTVSTESAITARYIKFILNVNAYVWIDEVQVISGAAPLSGGIYISGVNEKIAAGDCHIFTSAFNPISTSNANHTWTINAIAEAQADGTYIIKEVTTGEGDSTPSITLTDNQILIAAHNWESGVTDGSQVVGSAENSSRVAGLKVGDVITLDGITIGQTLEVSAAPYIKIVSGGATEDEPHVHVPGNAATCTSGQICTTCGEVLSPALGHSPSDWVESENKLIRFCITCGEVLDSKDKEAQDVYLGLRGDVNLTDVIDARDYLLLKRAYFGTYTLDDVARLLGDINENGGIDARDYLLLKRAYFGTYEITNPYVYSN